jgi:hypothetical protein
MKRRAPIRMPLKSWDLLGRAVLGALEAGARARMRGLGLRLGDTTTIDLRQAIVDQANSQGVPPAIALAVAMRESGITQWGPSRCYPQGTQGGVLTGCSGELGIFQLMPATAAQLGVDPTDPLQNIQGGVIYLAQMYQQFGSWPLALAAYNWGPVKLQRALNSEGSPPPQVQTYVAAVLAGAGVSAVMSTATWSMPSTSSIASTPDMSQAPDSADAAMQTFAPESLGSNGPLLVLGLAATVFGVKWLLE